MDPSLPVMLVSLVTVIFFAALVVLVLVLDRHEGVRQARHEPTPEQRWRWLRSAYPSLSATDPLTGRPRHDAGLQFYRLPKGVEAHPVADQIVLTDARGETLLVGENERGGYGFKTPGELHWHGNYGTLQDAVRHAAYDGFKADRR